MQQASARDEIVREDGRTARPQNIYLRRKNLQFGRKNLGNTGFG